MGGIALATAALSAATLAAIALAAVAARAEPDSGDGRDSQVRVATTGNASERVKTLRITRKVGARKRVVMSLGPGLPDLARGDRVDVTAELQVTTNCRIQGPRCRGPSYRYSPKVRARLVLAADARTKEGPGALRISGVKRETCTQKRPQYEHHCLLVFRDAGFDIEGPRRLPCLASCHVNLVADVHHRRASPGDLLMVGGQRPSGRIPQDRGRINAIRYRDAVPSQFPVEATTQLRKRRLPPDLKRRVVISRRLRGLRRNEQLAVEAAMRTATSHLPYAVRTSARLILAESPRATEQGDFVKSHARGFGEISENNGSNCTKHDSPCPYRKVGVLTMRRDSVDRGGREVSLYVNLVTVLGPKSLEAEADDRVRIRRGSIRVVRFPPKLRGRSRASAAEAERLPER